MDDTTRKTFTWAAAKAVAAGHNGVTPSDIRNVEFTTIYGGYCETCEYTASGYEITWQGAGGWGSLEIEDDQFVDIIRGISETEIDPADWAQ